VRPPLNGSIVSQTRMVPPVKRSLRTAVVAGSAYLVLWAATQIFGVPRVRAAVVAKQLPSPSEVARAPAGRANCDAIAVAPFIVRARYSWQLQPLLGEAGTVFYGWRVRVRGLAVANLDALTTCRTSRCSG